MTGAGASAADSHGVDEIQDIDLDQASDRDSAVGSTMDSYADKGKLNREQNKVLQRLLTLAFTMCGIPFACVANTHMKHVLKVLKPSFDPPGTTTMRTSLLEGLLSEVQLQHAAWLADDNLGRHLTMALDGWSNARMESVYAFNIIFPDRRVILLKSEDLSTTTHSGQNIADLVIKIMDEYGPQRFVGLVSDNAKNMVNMRKAVLQRFPHLIECRCMMHCFSTCMGSVMGHKWAENIVSRTQSVVTFFRASHKPLGLLKHNAAAKGIKRMLVTSNKTRFTSVHGLLESVLRLRESLMWLVSEHRTLLSATVLAALADHEELFLGISQLCQLLVPFTLVIHAVQSDDATMADVMRYWYFLARQMDAMKPRLTDPAFKAHCIAAFNWRVHDMHNPIAHLALFLHPWYRGTVSKTEDSYRSIRHTAASLWRNNGKSKEDTQKLLAEVDLYKQGARPFLGTMSDGGLDSLRGFWNGIQHTAAASGTPLQLPALAVIIHDIKPHAADPEKTFSLMGFFHTSRRNSLCNNTTTAMATIKMHHTYTHRSVVRKSKPVREIEALLQKEEDLQKAEEVANAETVAAEAAADVEQDACDIRAAPSMDLCSTEEMMSVFEEYYESDVKDMARSSINSTCIETGVDVRAKEFDLDFNGQADQVQVPDMDFGTTEPGAWSVDELL